MANVRRATDIFGRTNHVYHHARIIDRIESMMPLLFYPCYNIYTNYYYFGEPKSNIACIVLHSS